MNYRHAYHAGNFADVLKHLILMLCLDRMKHKEAPFFVLDAHAGCGIYDLSAVEAQKTLEYQGGIERLLSAKPASPDLRAFCALFEKDWRKRRYPGSPVICARMMRPQDRLLANELHPQDVEKLKANMAGYSGVRVLHMDGYEAVRAHLPPAERRGLILIDPPYEIEKDDLTILAKQLKEWKKKWQSGTYCIWYPLKEKQPVAPFFAAVEAQAFKAAWRCEIELSPISEAAGKMTKAGVVVINPPFQLMQRMQAVRPDLEAALGARIEDTEL